MTNTESSYQDYKKTRSLLIATIQTRLSDVEKKFLISFEAGEPQWELFPIPVLKELPAIKWKLLNIRKLIETKLEKHKKNG